MKKVLFVDDDPMVLRAMRDALKPRRTQWTMEFVSGAAEAMAAFAKTEFDVVIADMRMPEIDGATLLSWVQREHPAAIRIVLTGYAEEKLALRALAVAHQSMSKPCDPETLLGTVERASNLHGLLHDERLRRALGGVDALPSPPRTYLALLDLLRQPDVTTSRVAALIEEDVAMSAKLLHFANSAYFAPPRPITRMEDAVLYLGQAALRQLALIAAVFRTTQSRQLPFEAFEEHSIRTAAVARDLVGDRRVKQDAFLAGMLHDIGLLVIADHLPERWRETMAAVRADGEKPLHAIERDRWGVTHAEIGAYLIALWGLPDAIVEAVALHHTPQALPLARIELPTIVYVADHLARENGASLASTIGAAADPIDEDYLGRIDAAELLPHWRLSAQAVFERSARAA